MPNVLTEKLGPLPLWGWLGIATVGALLFASKGKGSSSNSQTAAQQAAAQQQLAAEEAALANSAQTATPASNSASSTYGSGGGRYGGNGNTGSAAPVYSATPAASTTTPVITSSSGGGVSSSSAPVDLSTAPAPVASATNYEYIIPYTTSSGAQMEDAVGGPNQAQAQSEAQTALSQLQSQGYTASVNPVVITQ